MNIAAQKAKRKLQDIAKKTAKDVGYELGEIPKRTPAQITGKDTSVRGQDASDQKISPIVEAMQQRTDFSDNEIEKKKQKKFIQDKSRVDEDVEKYRRKREELKQTWLQSQKQIEEEDKVEPGEPLPIPSSKPSRGKVHPGKQKSPEKRLGKK